VQPQLEPSAGGSSTLGSFRIKMRLGRGLKMSTPDFGFPPAASRRDRNSGWRVSPCNGLVGQTVQPTNPVPMNSSSDNDS
jgi:hypothetical protein